MGKTKTQKKKKNRGQITVFVIIAVVIVVLIGIIFFVTSNQPVKINTNDEGYNIILDCLKLTSEKGLSYIGSTGGYYYIPDKSTDYGTPYYFYDDSNLIPSLGNIENETSRIINERGSLCGFYDYPLYKEISKGKIKTKTTIHEDKVEFDVDYPLSVEKSGKRINYNNFNYEIPARVGILYKASSEYMQGQMETPQGICINCINDIANKYDVKFITYNYDNDTIIFNIIDENTKLLNQSLFAYTFAVKYDSNMNLSL
jgi:hypothetical protein